MDVASVILDSASTFTAALALFLSRLDVRKNRGTEPFDIYGALWNLTMEIHDWSGWAGKTDNVMRRWAGGDLDDQQASSALRGTLINQGGYYVSMSDLLDGTSDHGGFPRAQREAWTDLAHLLRMYEPTALESLVTAMDQRWTVTEGLGDELPGLRRAGQGAMDAAVSQLETATVKLKSANETMQAFMRENFPLSNWPMPPRYSR